MREWLIVAILAAAGAIVAFRWILLSDQTPNFIHDWAWSPLREQLAQVGLDRLNLWETGGLGGYNLSSATYAPLLVASAIAETTGSLFALKIIVIGCAIVGAAGTALIAKRYGAPFPMAMAIGVWYACSPVVADKLGTGHVNAWFAISALPYAALATDSLARGERLRSSVAVLALALAFIATQPGVFGVVALCVAVVCLCAGPRSFGAVLVAIGLAAATQSLPAGEIFSAAREGQVSELLPRVPWLDDSAIPLERLLSLRPAAHDYLGQSLGDTEPFVQFALATLGGISLIAIPLFMRGSARVAWFGSAAFVGLLTTLLRGPLREAGLAALISVPEFAVFRDPANLLEPMALAFAVGLAALSGRNRNLAVFTSFLIVTSFVIVASAPLGNIIPRPSFREGAPAAMQLASAPGNARIWPVPNGRFILERTSDVGGFDPFAGRLGSHAMLESYFATNVEAFARALPLSDAMPLLRAADVGFVWTRPWLWRAPGDDATRTRPRASLQKLDALPRLDFVDAVSVVPDFWPAGLAALRTGNDFVFARDAEPLGIREAPRAPQGDRSIVDPSKGPVDARIVAQSGPPWVALAGPSIALRGAALAAATFEPDSLLVTDGTPAPAGNALGTTAGATIYLTRGATRVHDATFAIAGERLTHPFARERIERLRDQNLVVERSTFMAERRAYVDGRELPHLRIDGYANGWLAPRVARERLTIVDTAEPLLQTLRAVSLLAWLCIAIVGLWPARARA